MTMDVKMEPQKGSGSPPQECAGCGKRITDRFLLKALDMYWHEDCLKCGCCDCRLGEVGSTLYTKANLILCRRDYLRLFGNTGYCAACAKVIPAFEMVMRARSNVYHLECFACQQCNHRFCVGDRFYLCENKILCEYDYEERLVFANMAYHPPSLAHLKRQTSQLPPPPPSSGGAAGGGAAGRLHGGGPNLPGPTGPLTGGGLAGAALAAAMHEAAGGEPRRLQQNGGEVGPGIVGGGVATNGFNVPNTVDSLGFDTKQ